jgi:hypothetical protein
MVSLALTAQTGDNRTQLSGSLSFQFNLRHKLCSRRVLEQSVAATHASDESNRGRPRNPVLFHLWPPCYDAAHQISDHCEEENYDDDHTGSL